jgi:malate synthase
MGTALTAEVRMQKSFEINYYHDYISPELLQHLLAKSKSVSGVNGLSHVGEMGGLENPESFQFLCDLYKKVKSELKNVLDQRIEDRAFIDQRVASCAQYNKDLKIDFNSAEYRTVIGLEDSNGRIVVGPKTKNFAKQDSTKNPVATIPDFLTGPHVTLFGPPDNAKLSINAMNAYHRKLKGEPAIVEELLATHESIPKWGADDEDSKTPLREDLILAGVNLTGCFNKTIKVEGDTENKYVLANDKLSLPIKRFPGLALPCFFLFLDNNPIPLHLYDFALHFLANWNNPKALCFYVPKLENEEEARYVKFMLQTAEELIKAIHPEYKIGTIRLMIVLENPRAILRAHEIMDELHPYFVGASLGWHDYLGSTARLFKEDSNYRIPVKADPNIVIKYIKGSHDLLASVVGSRGGVKVGGMYGILPINNDLFSDSFQMTMKGYFKDVVTQLKRNLTGFWVAHPDFVRIGLALVEAWKFHKAGDKTKLEALIEGLLDSKHRKEILDFVFGPDIEGLDVDDPLFVRSLLVADIKESTYIANNHPDEIRYNVFQSLQYLTDWLTGNGCVALPAQIGGVPVRVMDDLATAERSRWEVWHEIRHERFSLTEFLKIAHEELHFIRKDLSDGKKIVQVKWDERTAKWYPVAMKLMIKLMTDKNPVEFATELLLPFTMNDVRAANDPWAKVATLDASKFSIDQQVKRFNYYFEMCGCYDFALKQMSNVIVDEESIQKSILSFSKSQIIEAASFHGNIGEGKKTLDEMATEEQALVFNSEEVIKQELATLGSDYLNKFGVKFLVSAKGKSGSELLSILKERINNSEKAELDNARKALLEITLKRIAEHPLNNLWDKIQKAAALHRIKAAQIAISSPGTQLITLGEANDNTYFEFASLSKTVASAIAIETFWKMGFSLEDRVNDVFAKTKSSFRIKANSPENAQWADEVRLKHLMNHQALNMHYVKGYPASEEMPAIESLLNDVFVINEPGTKFQYSGGGYIVLEHLLETLTGKKITQFTKEYLKNFTFDQMTIKGIEYAKGYDVKGNIVEGTRLMFPSFAAGSMGTAAAMADFLQHFTRAYESTEGSGPLSHDVVREMMHSTDNGCKKFMGCEMGLGVFVAYAGDNKFIIHQGANDGFRAIFLHCVDGPDTGKGFVIQCSGELNGVLFISEIAQQLIKELDFSGIDFSQFKGDFKTDNISQEEVVNIGYKNLIFDAFLPNLPERIVDVGPKDPMSEINLAVGGKILEVTNQRFARAENLLSPFLPVFDPKLYGRQGKIMDSWETVRHNQKECDVLIFELQKPSQIAAVSLSTKFHFGNQAESARVEGFADGEWHDILPFTKLQGHAYLYQESKTTGKTFTLIRVSNYPDGGISRLGLYQNLDATKISSFVFSDEIPMPKKPLSIPYNPESDLTKLNWSRLNKGDEVNLSSMAFGARVLKASNEHYGPAVQVISPFAPMNMFDGLESARSRKAGHSEEVIVELARPDKIKRIEMDFTYFVNNNPLFVSVHALSKGEWVTLIAKNKVKAFAGSTKIFNLADNRIFEQVRVVTYPDGGMNRLRVIGNV